MPLITRRSRHEVYLVCRLADTVGSSRIARPLRQKPSRMSRAPDRKTHCAKARTEHTFAIGEPQGAPRTGLTIDGTEGRIAIATSSISPRPRTHLRRCERLLPFGDHLALGLGHHGHDPDPQLVRLISAATNRKPACCTERVASSFGWQGGAARDEKRLATRKFAGVVSDRTTLSVVPAVARNRHPGGSGSASTCCRIQRPTSGLKWNGSNQVADEPLLGAKSRKG